jgi:hypothetical protein
MFGSNPVPRQRWPPAHPPRVAYHRPRPAISQEELRTARLADIWSPRRDEPIAPALTTRPDRQGWSGGVLRHDHRHHPLSAQRNPAMLGIDPDRPTARATRQIADPSHSPSTATSLQEEPRMSATVAGQKLKRTAQPGGRRSLGRPVAPGSRYDGWMWTGEVRDAVLER